MNTNTRTRILSLAATAGVATLASATAHAQLYIATQSAAPYVSLGTTGTAINFIDGDEGAQVIPIGFPFVYYGQSYTHVNVGVNGTVSMAAPCSGTCADVDEICGSAGVCEREYVSFFISSGLPNTTTPDATIAPFWGDLLLDNLLSPVGSVRYAVQGTAPNRELVVEWQNARFYFFFGGTTSYTNFQVRLSEATSGIRLAYGTYSASSFDDTSWSGIIGIENQDATDAVVPLPCAVGMSRCDYTTLQGLQGQVIDFVVPNTPELVAFVTPPTGADPGDPISVAVDVRNLGPQPANTPFTADVYLSTDTTITPGTDTLLGTLQFTSIGAQSIESQVLDVTLSASTAPGLYRVGVIVDPANAVAEALETNNTAVSTTQFLVGKDISIAIDTIPGTGPEETITFPLRLINNGSAVPSVEWAVYFSRDQLLDGTDTLLASGSDPLPAVPVTEISVQAVVPILIPGDYYAIAVADPMDAVVEADETNNTASAPAITQLRGADVVAVSVDGSQFAFRGEAYRVTAVLSNTGLSTAEDFTYSFHLSTNQLITFTDPLLGEIGPISLLPGEQVTVVHDLVISSTIAAGPYYLGLIGDSSTVVLEELENNNIKHRRDPVTVRDPAPDITGSNVILPLVGAAGESLTIERLLSNDGNAPADAAYDIYFSTDETLEPEVDHRVGGGTVTLGIRADDRDIDRVRVPSSVPAGDYYVIYVLDPADQLSELFEDNNLVVSEGTIDVLAAQLSILTRVLPRATLNLPYEHVLAAAGGAGGYTWSISAGALPQGVMLDPASGKLSGTPTEIGLFTLTVTVSDGTLEVSEELPLLVGEQTLPLEILTRSIVPAFTGRAYQYPLTAFGGIPPYTWIAREALPAGLELSEAGVIFGTPTTPNVATINFNVTDATGAGADRPIVVRIVNSDSSVRFSNAVLPDGDLGEQYAESLRVEPGTGASPYHFALASGELPPGLSLENDQVLGVPTAVGTFLFEVRLTDSRGDFDVNLFVLTIREASGVNISTSSLPEGVVGTMYLDEGGVPVRIKAFSTSTSGSGVTFLVLSGALPPGLELAEDGAITGTPSQAGVYSFIVQASDAAGQTTRSALGIRVSDPLVEPTPIETGDCSCTAERGSARGGLGLLLMLGVLVLVRRRAGLVAVLLALAAPSSAWAQAVPYFQSSRTETYVHRSGGTSLGFPSLDDGTAVATLPFSFRFYDTDYTSVVIGTNGAVAFDPATSWIGTFADPIPTPGEPDAMIALFWDDLVVTGVTTHVEGVSPARTFIIQWEGVVPYGGGAGTTEFQLWLYEGLSGKFEIHYGPATGVAPFDWTGAIGYENATGTVGTYLLPCGGSCDGSTLTNNVDMVYAVQQDGGTEIVAQAVSAPSVVYPGINFDVTVTLASQHQNSVGPFVYEVQLLEQGQNPPGITILRSTPVTLTPYQVLMVATSTAIPLATLPGRYRLALIADADDDVDEPDENNNVIVAASDFRVDPPQPDFTIARVSPAEPVAAPGAQVTIELDLANSGNLDGATSWKLYLSRNSVVSTDDLEIASGSESLALLTTANLSVPVTLPNDLNAGPYYVGAIADPENSVSELSEVNNAGVGTNRLVIATSGLSVATTSLPLGYVDITYSTYLFASGGDGSYAWSLDSGSLPAGLALIPTTGELRGRPTEAGSTTFTVKVTSGMQTATSELTLQVSPVAAGLTIVTQELLPGLVGGAYPPADPDTAKDQQQHIIAAGGSGEVTFALEGIPPPGLTLDPDGYLHGVPTQLGVYSVTVAATDAMTTVRRTIPLTIAEPGRLTLVAASLPDGRVGEDYDYQIRVLGAAPNAMLSFTSPNPLPMGLSLTSTGRITGVPEVVAVAVFTVTVTDGMAMNAPRDEATYRISIGPDAEFRITPTTAPIGEIGKDYEVVFEAVMGSPPYTWRISGQALPRGLTSETPELDGVHVLRIRGVPEVEGLVSERISVFDAAGRGAELAVSFLVVSPPEPPRLETDSGCTCVTRPRERVPGVAFSVLALVALGIMGRSRRRSR